MRKALIRLRFAVVLVAVVAASATVPTSAQEGGMDPRDPFYVSGPYGEAHGMVTWDSDTLAEVNLIVSDSRYDGWCAVVVTDAANFGMWIDDRACGAGTSQEGYSNPAAAPMSTLHTVTFTICGYYPPGDVWDCGDTDALDNPLD